MSEPSPEQLEIAYLCFDDARDGMTQRLLAYVDAGVPADLTDAKGNTLLMLAAYHGHAEIVGGLLARGADPDRVNHRGQSPLAGAVFKGEDDVVAVLLDAGADLDAGGPSARETARYFGREDLLPDTASSPSGDSGSAGSTPDAEGSTTTSLETAARERLTVRVEEDHDAEAVRSVIEAAFGTEGAKTAALWRELAASRDAVPGLSAVALREGEVVGHVGFSAALLDTRERLLPILCLGPLAVHPQAQGRGIATELLRWALARLDGASWPLVVLEGDPEYYARFGFEAGEPLGLRRPSLRTPSPAFQMLRLSGHEPGMTGTVVYSRIFWDHDAVGLRDPELARIEQTLG